MRAVAHIQFNMDKTNKIAGEITVRVSLGFQDSPDVHTLLAMTPVRQRGKLVRLALERYITETGHPAGKPEVQLEAISHWLKMRCNASLIEPSQIGDRPCEVNIFNNIDHIRRSSFPARPVAERRQECSIGPVEPEQATISKSVTSQSISRWLKT